LIPSQSNLTSLENSGSKLSRITCFVVDRNYSRRGVASVALDSALESIKEKGGGVVDAYPATRKGALAVWFGKLSMFEKRGFRTIAPYGRSNVLTRRTI